MEENNDLKELSIILGLNEIDLNKNVSIKKNLSFIGSISDILYSDKLNDLYKKSDLNDDKNEMIDDFIKKAEIDGIGQVKLELYKNSNFVENIKGNVPKLNSQNINYTEKYLTKLQNEFIKEEKIISPPIEIKEQKNEKNEYNKKKYQNKNRQKPRKMEEREKKINEENDDSKVEQENTNKEKEEELEERKEKNENEIIEEQNKEYEENEKSEEKKNNYQNQQRNYRKPYNRKYNKNKGHKEYRQNINSRNFKK